MPISLALPSVTYVRRQHGIVLTAKTALIYPSAAASASIAITDAAAGSVIASALSSSSAPSFALIYSASLKAGELSSSCTFGRAPLISASKRRRLLSPASAEIYTAAFSSS